MYERKTKLEVSCLVDKAWSMRQAIDRDPLDAVTPEGAMVLERKIIEFFQIQAASSERDAQFGLDILAPYIFHPAPPTGRGGKRNYDIHRELFALGLLGKKVRIIYQM